MRKSDLIGVVTFSDPVPRKSPDSVAYYTL